MQLTYNTLVSGLLSFVEDTTTDLVIAMGEDRLLRDLDLDIFSDTDDGSADAEIAKPSDFLYLRSPITLSSGITFTILEERSYSYLKVYWPSASAAGVPRYYAHKNETTFAIAPTPIGYTYEFSYGKRPIGLSSGNQETWLSKTVGDALMRSCILSAHEYLKKDPDQIQAAMSEYSSAMQASRAMLSSSLMVRTSPVQSVGEKAEVKA